jgi:hypothetical protein
MNQKITTLSSLFFFNPLIYLKLSKLFSALTFSGILSIDVCFAGMYWFETGRYKFDSENVLGRFSSITRELCPPGINDG